MKPILYKSNETTFETYGLGEIDATKALVTRERNGNYTLYIEYPASGRLASVFKNDMRIKSDAGLRTKNQTFYISRIVKSSKGIIKIYAKHISHLTELMAMRNGTLVNGTASSALSIWASNTLGGVRFDTWSDITTSNRTSWDIANVKNAREALGGREGSILDVWGGEFEFDNTTIRLHKQLGRKSPIVLEYGRNILSAEDEQDIGSTYTSIYPYATYTPESTGSTDGHSEAITVELPEKYIDSKYVGLYNERRVEIVDFSSSFKEKEVPTAAKLRNLANAYIINNNVGLPKINTKIEYVDLSKAQDHASNQILEEAELCDIVPIFYPPIGLTSEDGKLTTIVFDVLRGVNDSVEVGTIGEGIRSAMTSGLATQVSDIAKSQKQLVDTLPKYLLNAQGNKVWYNRPDANIEHKVGDIWFEKNGLYDRMYIWNGTMWEKRIDTEDVDRVKKEVNRQLEETKTTTDRAIAEANKRAEEALVKAGTIPDTSKLSDQIKQQILSSPDLQNKVTEGVKSVDGDTIYSKIVSKVSQQFANKTDLDGLNRTQTDQGRDLLNLSKQITAQTLEYNKLTESNKIFERILGKTESEAPDKLSRLVMSSDIFQTEVGKYSTSGGPNMLRNSRADDGLKYWTEPNNKMIFTAHSFYFNGQKKMFSLRPGAVVKSPRFIVKKNTDYTLNVLGFDNNSKYFRIYFCKRRKGTTADFEEKQLVFDGRPQWTDGPVFNSTKSVKKSFKFNIGEFDDGYLQFEYDQNNPNKWAGLFMTELDFYEGTNDRKWQPAPEDATLEVDKTVEATRTQVTQLAGSWAVRNLNNSGDVLGAINLNLDGSVRINEGLLSVGEKTIIKDGVIKKSMIGTAQIGTAHIEEIDANIARLINVSAKNIVSDGLTANIIHGGVLASKNEKLKFDLDNSALESTSDESVIKRIGSGANSPTQFLKFSKGWIQGRSQPVGLTILGSNRYGDGRSEDGNSGGFAGIRIWNGSNAEGYADSVDIVGDEIVLCDSPFQNRNGWLMKTTYSDTSLFSITNKRNSRIYAGDFLFEKSGGGNASLRQILWQIGDNIAQLYKFRNQHNEGTPGWNDTNKWGWS